MIPKTSKAVENEFERCLRNKAFVKIPKERYIDYVKEAYEDLSSAEKEESDKWAITKAYQSLFMMCNALLVRHLGLYSKDHGCVIVALMKEEILSQSILKTIYRMLKDRKAVFSGTKVTEAFFEQIFYVRMIRNKYLYIPRTQRKVRTSPTKIIDEIKETLKILSGVL